MAFTLAGSMLFGVHSATAQGGGSVGPGGSVNFTAPPPPPPNPTGTGAISGVVVDGQTGRPLADVVVMARIEGRPVTTPLAPRPVGQQVTDARGRFVFTDLPAADGFTLTARRGGYFTTAYGAPRGASTGTRIVLAEGEWFSKADISMWPTAAITGRVLDDRGDPVVGAYVRVLRQIFVAGSTHLAPSGPVMTDDRGMYRIAGLDPGKYIVCVPSVQASVPISVGPMNEPAIDVDGANRLVAGRYLMPPSRGPMSVYPTACYPERSPMSQATAIEVDFGADRGGIDLRLQPVPAFRVAGRVDGPSGAPSRLTLRLLAVGTEGLGLGGEVATALVASDGAFTFLGVPSGSYVIDARGSMSQYAYFPETVTSIFSTQLPVPPQPAGAGGSGMSSSGIASGPPRSNFVTRTVGGTDHGWTALPVVVDAGDVTGLTVPLRPAITLSGRLVFDGAAAVPARPSVFAEMADGNPTGYRQRTFDPNAPATVFQISGLMPGNYFLRAANLGEAWTVRSVVVNGREYDRVPFTFSGSEATADATITVTDKVITLTGDVRDPQGVPDTSTTVVVFPANQNEWRDFGMTPDRMKTVRATTVGGYRLVGLPAGDYFVVAVDDAQAYVWQNPEFFESASRVATRVTLNWGESKRVNLVRMTVR